MDFLLEIGTEEIPDWMIEPALEHLKGAFTKLLTDNKLKGEVVWAEATPRRLAVQLTKLPKGQKTETVTETGPPASAGPKAAEGFARKMGVYIESLVEANGRYTAQRVIEGRTTEQILAAALPQLILAIPWPKTMYWLGKGTPRFIRPIRWLVALLGSSVVDFDVAGVKASNLTYGHRRLAKSKKPIRISIKNYEQKLLENFVVLRAAARRQKIEAGMEDLGVKPDAGLLHTLTYITEYPTPIIGSFDESYLELPQEVLITVMRHHQKYFSVLRADGSLAPQFVAVMNTDADPEGFVRAGNERVLRARFNDARFFFEKDQEKPLSARINDLKAVTFQKEVGSYFEKVERMMALVPDEASRRACQLAKCDLTTEMVKEFTDLQGIVGGIYARKQGEPEEVAKAIYEHYKPLSMEDSVPATRAGQWVALADKIDTLRECFRVGLIPSGSKDPFALRRAAQGVVKILVEGRVLYKFRDLWETNTELSAFFMERLRYYFREVRGFAYDEVNAVLHAQLFYHGVDYAFEAEERIGAIHELRASSEFLGLCSAFRRIRNILSKEGWLENPLMPSFQGELQLPPGPEEKLWAAFREISAGVSSESSVSTSLAKISELRPSIDLFFETVLVNDPDVQVRNRRFAMLNIILDGFLSIADFSELVIVQSKEQA